jgi:outer membrane protein TolC
MVGPDYVTPAVITPQSFKEADGWKVARPGDGLPRGRWWEIFGDAELNALAEQVAEANQDLQVAGARFREARAIIGFYRPLCSPRSRPESASAPSAARAISRSSRRHRPPPATF